MEGEGIKLYVNYHEWAWSLRTQGFPVYALVQKDDDFELVEIGSTQKRPTCYIAPPNTVIVVRKYRSNSSLLYYYCYRIVDNKPVEVAEIAENNNFDIRCAEELNKEEIKALEWLSNHLKQKHLQCNS